MVFLPQLELEQYREHINDGPPLSEISTPEDVDRLALNTVIHNFVYSRYEMPFADYIRYIRVYTLYGTYSVDKRIRRPIYDIDRGAVEQSNQSEVECLSNRNTQ